MILWKNTLCYQKLVWQRVYQPFSLPFLNPSALSALFRLNFLSYLLQRLLS